MATWQSKGRCAVLIVFVLAQNVSCQYAPITSEMTTDHINVGDIVGVYSRVEAVGVDPGESLSHVPTTIELRSDETGILTFDGTAGLHESDASQSELSRGSVALMLSRVDAGGSSGWGIELSSRAMREAEMRIVCLGDRSTVRLAVELGDPDEGRYVIFAR